MQSQAKMIELDLNSVRIEVDAEERDDVASWVSAKSYKQVLTEARASCSVGRHLMTLREYMALWLHTVKSGGSIACNEADIWLKVSSSLSPEQPTSNFRHPFKSTVLVDTWLQDFTYSPKTGYEAAVFEGGIERERVAIPAIGKIYELNHFGLPCRTGGKKSPESDAFEHRWWAFSSERIRLPGESIRTGRRLALFANGGTIGCFSELIKAHYTLEEAGGFYRVLSCPDHE